MVRMGAGNTGYIDAVSAPFEYPCLERGESWSSGVSVLVAPMGEVN